MRWFTLGLILILSGQNIANADESITTVVGGVDFGFKKLRLEIDRTRSSFSPSYVTINPTFVLGYRSFYMGLSYDKSLGTEPGNSETDNGGGSTATTTNFSRADSTITLGYRLNPSFSLFTGDTKGVSHYTETSFVSTLTVTHTDYTETGPFAGIAYKKIFGNAGNLGLSVAYAKLDGRLDVINRPGGAESIFAGKTTGLSYGLTWSGTLMGSLGYHVGVKKTRYEMTNPVDIVESYTNFFIGIANYF